MSLYLGLDAGGSCARWAWLDAEGNLLRSGERRPWRVESGVTESVRGILAEALSGAGDFARCVTGVAGASDPEVRRAVASAFDGRPVDVVGDTVLAAAAALWGGPGVALWSGTGSFAVARDRSGRLVRVGGRGPWLGDEGSGFDVVRRACAAAVACADGWGGDTALVEALEGALEADVGRWPALFATGDRAALAAVFATVCRVADSRDVVARDVLVDAASSLARQVDAVARRAELSSDYPVWLGGGAFRVASYSGFVVDALAQRGWARVMMSEAETGQVAARLARALDLDERPQAQWVHDGAP